jgi:ABC-type uncharacterized transport system permease subunit
MKKKLCCLAVFFILASIFFQYKAVDFASGIVTHIREFGQVLAAGEATPETTDFFFQQAEKIQINAQDSFISQQFSLGFLTAALLCLIIAFLHEKKEPIKTSD